MLNFRALLLTAIMTTLGASEAFAAEANCFCKVSSNDLTNQTSASGVLKDYGSLYTYSGVFPQNDSNQTNCNTRCTNATGGDGADVQNRACAAGIGNGVIIRAFSAVGTKEYKTAHYHGKVQRTAAVYNCPQGGSLSGTSCTITQAAIVSCGSGFWLENAFKGNSSIKKCVKQACAANSMPGAGAWLSIGAGNGGEYLTDDAGGSRFFINPKVSCPDGFNVSGYNCVKQYSAALVSAASCSLIK